MTQPLVSVIMCTYNGSQFIDEQIKSILDQDYQQLELIIVDDVSSDDTWQKLEQWKQKDDRISIYKNEINIGYNKNFEKSIQRGNGEFIAISDQDDTWLPSKISKQVASFSSPDVMLSHTKSVRLENGRLRYKSAALFNHFSGSDSRKLFMFNQINGHDIVFRRSLLDKIVPIPAGMMYDWWMALVATCYGRIASVDECLVHHRIHQQNNFFSASTSTKQLDLADALNLFLSIKALKPASKIFLVEFINQLQAHNQKKDGDFDGDFFRYLYRNGSIFFGHKKRFIPPLHYLKSALRFARFNFKNKGIAF